MALLIVLLVITLVLVGLVGLMGYRIQLYRKQQEMAAYSSMSSTGYGNTELVDRNGF